MLHLEGTEVKCEEWGKIIRASIYGNQVRLRKDNVNDRSILSRSQFDVETSAEGLVENF